jgi:hypothetical protein
MKCWEDETAVRFLPLAVSYAEVHESTCFEIEISINPGTLARSQKSITASETFGG